MEDAPDLLERVAEGDIAAFEAVYDRYHRLVYSVAFKVLGREAAAEDVTQAVFLKIWTSPKSFRGGNLAGWIARIARNRAIDVLRRSDRERELPPEIPCEGLLDETAFARIDAARARMLMENLPPEQHNAIELAFFGGLTYAEVAAKTGTPLGTVKTRIRAGLQTLRAALTEAVR